MVRGSTDRAADLRRLPRGAFASLVATAAGTALLSKRLPFLTELSALALGLTLAKRMRTERTRLEVATTAMPVEVLALGLALRLAILALAEA